jgi:hypothetical protein
MCCYLVFSYCSASNTSLCIIVVPFIFFWCVQSVLFFIMFKVSVIPPCVPPTLNTDYNIPDYYYCSKLCVYILYTWCENFNLFGLRILVSSFILQFPLYTYVTIRKWDVLTFRVVFRRRKFNFVSVQKVSWFSSFLLHGKSDQFSFLTHLVFLSCRSMPFCLPWLENFVHRWIYLVF